MTTMTNTTAGAAATTGDAGARAKDRGGVVDVAPAEVDRMLGSGEAVLIDVRQPFEHAEERIADSRLEPLPGFDPEKVRRAVREGHADRAVVFMCRTGKRSAAAARRYAQQTGEPGLHLAGGIVAWRAQQLPVIRPALATRLPVMRQVQITAGSLVALGVALGVLVSPWLLAIPAFVGCGLVFAGATGWCGMAKLLAAMPWNRAGDNSDGTTTRGACCG